jgi:hypothetical protein
VFPSRLAPLLCTVSLCCLGVVTGPSTSTGQIGAQRGSLEGIVLDDETGETVAGVGVELLDGETRRRLRRTLTDADGFFRFPDMRPGSFRLRASRIGYEQVVTPRWHLRAQEVLSVEVRIRVDAVLLAPLEIVAQAAPSRSPVVEDLAHRMRHSPTGRFIRQEDIRPGASVSGLIATLPGVRLEPLPGGRGTRRQIVMGRSLPGRGGGTCPVQVFVDGLLVSRATSPGGAADPVDVDDLVSAIDILAIEVYTGTAALPAEFVTSDSRCGVVAIWTRRGA